MSRKPTEIQPIRAERLKELIKDLNMSQTDFSKSVNYSQQHISGIINQKTALTEETAQDIISVYPDYRIEWLLGYDDIDIEICSPFICYKFMSRSSPFGSLLLFCC